MGGVGRVVKGGGAGADSPLFVVLEALGKLHKQRTKLQAELLQQPLSGLDILMGWGLVLQKLEALFSSFGHDSGKVS